MNPPRLICFDAFDTLVGLDEPVGRLCAALARRGWPVSPARAAAAFSREARLYRDLSLLAVDAARLHTVRRACARELLRALRPVIGPHHDHAEAVEILLTSLEFRVLDGAHETLAELRARGYLLAVVSNWDCGLPAVLDALDLTRWFDVVAVSALVGCEKPDPRLWRSVLDPLGVTPSQAWHVGDELVNDVEGAAAAGLRPVLLGDAAAPGTVPRIGALRELLPLLEGGA